MSPKTPAAKSPKTDNVTPVNPQVARALALANKLNQHKGCSVTTADKIAQPFWLRRPTGIMSLDVDMGGGAPAGCIVQLLGAENCGKSMVLFHMFAMQQRIYGDACVMAYISTENAPDYFFMRKCGCMIPVPEEVLNQDDYRRIAEGLQPRTQEERDALSTGIGIIHILQGATGEDLLGAILEMVEANIYSIIGVDSMTVIMPAEEENKDLDDNMKKATHASLVTRFVNKWQGIMSKCTVDDTNYTTVVAIEQVRANQDKSMYNPADYKSMVPYALKHATSISVFIKSESKLRSTKSADKGQVIGKTMKWETIKGKHGCRDGTKGELDLHHSNFDSDKPPIELNKTVLIAGLTCGVITDKGGSFVVSRSNGDTIASGIPSVEALLQNLQDDPEFDQQVRLAIVRKNKGPDYVCAYKKAYK